MADTPSAPHQPKRLHPLYEGRVLMIVTGLGLTLAMLLLLVFPPLLVRQADLRLYDLMLSGRASPPLAGAVTLVGIDEESLQIYGQWPWPRYRLARLVERLRELGATVVALDFLMPEPDRTSPEVLLAERQLDQGRAVDPKLLPALDSNSRQLAEAVAGGATVLGYFFDFTGAGGPAGKAPPPLPAGLVVTRQPGSDASWPKPNGVLRSLPTLTAAAPAEGFTNALHDRDGALRRVPLLLPYDGELYPSLALAALLLASPERSLRLSRESGETTLAWGDRRIPLDREGNLALDFRDERQPFPYLSARSVLAGESAPGSLRGKIVLVGPWAKGLGDAHLVPSGHFASGLVVHATVIDNLLAGTFIATPGWAGGAGALAILGLGLLCTWLLSRSGFLLSLATVTAGAVGCYWLGWVLLVTRGLYLSPLLPMLTPVAIVLFLGLLKYGIEARKVRMRTLDLIEAQDMIIRSLSMLTEARDKGTGGHILRTQRYVEILARQLATTPAYRDLDESTIELLAKSAPLHDIGKVGVADSILNKPGKLTDQEYALMKGHTLIGAEALAKSIGGSGHPEQLDFLRFARQMIESHHERWDGGGYPHGLRGEEIPLAGRLMALADVYDAMVSRRIYKQGIEHSAALDLICKNSGSQFDPAVVAAFVARQEDFFRVARDLADAGEPPAAPAADAAATVR